MATAPRWIKNLYDPTLVGPMVYPGLFQAGATQAITKGALLKRTADTNTRWTPADDHDAAAGSGLALAAQEIASGDLAGYYELWIPRPGDVWEFDLAAASALAPETALYPSGTAGVVLTVTAGSNIVAYSVIGSNFPGLQKRLSQGQTGDFGETFRSTSKVWAVFRAACSFYKTIQKA